jgi:hypothetical protein
MNNGDHVKHRSRESLSDREGMGQGPRWHEREACGYVGKSRGEGCAGEMAGAVVQKESEALTSQRMGTANLVRQW